MKIAYRPEIDGLRAIAVVAVIFYHAQINIYGYQTFQGGFIGVDIFFVISGYLITSIILNELIITNNFSFKYFYERRVRRILPVMLIVMIASLPFAWIYLLPNSLVDFSKSILYSLGFSSNFYFHYSGQIYGSESGLLKPFLHNWSLSVEEQYYILFPIILLVAFKYFRKYLIYFLIFGFILSLGLADWGSRNHPSFTFYILPTRGWELLAGSILAYFEITTGHRSKNKKLALFMPVIGLFMVLCSILFFSDEMRHPSFFTLIPIVGVCLIIWFSNEEYVFTKILSTKLFVGIGLISYSLYLWHYPIFSFLRIYKEYWLIYETKNLFLIYFLTLLLLVLLSIISFFYIEKIFRNNKVSYSKVFIFIVSLSTIIIITCLYFINSNNIKKKFHPYLYKYDKSENKKFETSYNFNDFNHRENIFLIGNSYADNLLAIFNFNKNLKNKYYFYTAMPNYVKNKYDTNSNFQLHCLLSYLKNIEIKCDKNLFTFFKKQYEMSNYIIFHNKENHVYHSNQFKEIVSILKKDNKKFVVFLNDIHGADILDKFLLKNNRIPIMSELNYLQEKIYKNKDFYDKEHLNKAINYFNKNNIKYYLRSQIYCNKFKQSCDLLFNNNKIYADYGHITMYGAKFFSNSIVDLIDTFK